MEVSNVLVKAFRDGRFLQAYQVLLQNAPSSDLEKVLAAELLHLIGKTPEALRLAARVLQSTRASTDLNARCTLLVAEAKWQSGRRKEALELHQKAIDLAERSRDPELVCRTSSTFSRTNQ